MSFEECMGGLGDFFEKCIGGRGVILRVNGRWQVY